MPKRPLFLAIGVHKPDTMAELPGVLPSIDGMTKWATTAGYDTLSVDERSGRVTVERIKDLLTPKDPITGERNPALLLGRPRIVIYFCGHGLHASGDQYWVLSAGPDQSNERISAVGFRDALASYGPKQIAVISDACRTAQAFPGAAQSVVDFNRGEADPVQKDNFFSSQQGAASFSMPPGNGDPGYCVFSRVLLRALSAPPESTALDELYLELGKQIVSSQSLATYLETSVPDAALDIGKLQKPQCDPGFRPKKNDYVNFSVPMDGRSLDYGSHTPIPRAPDRKAHRAAIQNQRISDSKSEWREPYGFAAAQFASSLKHTSPSDARPPPLILSARDRGTRFRVYGKNGEIAGEKTEPPSQIGDLASRRHWLFRQYSGFGATRRSSVLLCRSGPFTTALPMFDRLWCNVIIESAGDGAGHRGGVELVTWGPWFNPLEVPSPGFLKLSSAEALKGMSSGVLRSEDIPVLAAAMRVLKHADPLYGVVAAYLYHRVGDIENIRRMCAYYKGHGQDVPFDIAMLAQLKLQRRGAGFFVDVPKIRELPKSRRAEDAPYFVWEGKPAARVKVAGVTPVLRVGWQHLGASPHPAHRQCSALMDWLTDSPIATFLGKAAFETLHGILQEF